MSDPWFPEWAGGLFGAGVGLLGGIYGTVVSFCASRGLARRAVIGFHFACLAGGVALLIAAIVAGLTGQPYGVWYSLGLCGLLLTILMGAFTPMLFARYREAELRMMAARNVTE